MPLDGEQLDELLSGFVDGALTQTEQALLEEAARADARVAQRIADLRQQSSWVRQYGRGLAEESSVTPGLAQRVIEVARQRGRAEGLPVDHYIQPYAESAVEPSRSASLSVELAGRQSGRWVAWGGIVTAAALLVAVTWPMWQKPDADRLAKHNSPAADLAGASDSLDSADNTNAENTNADNLVRQDSLGAEGPLTGQASEPAQASSSLVGKSTGMSYVLVIDVQITAKAQRMQALEKILAAAGIPLAPPVEANPEVLKALDDSRLIVRNPTATTQQISVQVVRGDMHEIDMAFRNVWQDRESFPNVAMNVSIDSRATLMRAMLQSAGSRFAPTDSFALPLALQPTTTSLVESESVVAEQEQSGEVSGVASPFPGADGGVQYVSSGQRARGWGGVGELSASNRDSMATILLVLHRVD